MLLLVAWVRSLAWEILHALGMARKEKKKAMLLLILHYLHFTELMSACPLDISVELLCMHVCKGW